MKARGDTILRVLLTVAVFAGLTASLVQGKAEYTKKERVACTACHTKANSKELNEVGKCYGKTRSLKECSAAEYKKK